MNDTEINEAVALKLGWKQAIYSMWYPPNPPIPDRPSAFALPSYSTDIKAAWEVVEKCPMALVPFRNGHWYATTMGMPEIEGDCFEIWAPINCATKDKCCCGRCVVADTAPRAICEAFLKLP